MSGEEKGSTPQESSYPMPKKMEFSDIQKRLQKFCDEASLGSIELPKPGFSPTSQSMEESDLPASGKKKKGKKKKKKKTVMEEDTSIGVTPEQVVHAAQGSSDSIIHDIEPGAMGFPPIQPIMPGGPDEQHPSVTHESGLSQRGRGRGFGGRGRGFGDGPPFPNRPERPWGPHDGPPFPGGPRFHGPGGPRFRPPFPGHDGFYGPNRPPYPGPGYYGQGDPNAGYGPWGPQAYQGPQYYGPQTGPPYSGPQQDFPQWNQYPGYQGPPQGMPVQQEMPLATGQYHEQPPATSLPQPDIANLPLQQQLPPQESKPVEPLPPSAPPEPLLPPPDIASIPVPPSPPKKSLLPEIPLPSAIPMPESEPSVALPTASDSIKEHAGSSETESINVKSVSESTGTLTLSEPSKSESTKSSMEEVKFIPVPVPAPEPSTEKSEEMLERQDEKRIQQLTDMDVPAMSPGEPEELNNVTEHLTTSGGRTLIVDATPTVGTSPTAELDMEEKEHEADVKEEATKGTKTTAQLLLEKVAAKKKKEEQGSDMPGKTLLRKPVSKFLLQQGYKLKETTEKTSEGEKEKKEVKDSSGSRNVFRKSVGGSEDEKPRLPSGGPKGLFLPSSEDKIELVTENMTPKQREFYFERLRLIKAKEKAKQEREEDAKRRELQEEARKAEILKEKIPKESEATNKSASDFGRKKISINLLPDDGSVTTESETLTMVEKEKDESKMNEVSEEPMEEGTVALKYFKQSRSRERDLSKESKSKERHSQSREKSLSPRRSRSRERKASPVRSRRKSRSRERKLSPRRSRSRERRSRERKRSPRRSRSRDRRSRERRVSPWRSRFSPRRSRSRDRRTSGRRSRSADRQYYSRRSRSRDRNIPARRSRSTEKRPRRKHSMETSPGRSSSDERLSEKRSSVKETRKRSRSRSHEVTKQISENKFDSKEDKNHETSFVLEESKMSSKGERNEMPRSRSRSVSKEKKFDFPSRTLSEKTVRRSWSPDKVSRESGFETEKEKSSRKSRFDDGKDEQKTTRKSKSHSEERQSMQKNNSSDKIPDEKEGVAEIGIKESAVSDKEKSRTNSAVAEVFDVGKTALLGRGKIGFALPKVAPVLKSKWDESPEHNGDEDEENKKEGVQDSKDYHSVTEQPKVMKEGDTSEVTITTTPRQAAELYSPGSPTRDDSVEREILSVTVRKESEAYSPGSPTRESPIPSTDNMEKRSLTERKSIPETAVDKAKENEDSEKQRARDKSRSPTPESSKKEKSKKAKKKKKKKLKKEALSRSVSPMDQLGEEKSQILSPLRKTDKLKSVDNIGDEFGRKKGMAKEKKRSCSPSEESIKEKAGKKTKSKPKRDRRYSLSGSDHDERAYSKSPSRKSRRDFTESMRPGQSSVSLDSSVKSSTRRRSRSASESASSRRSNSPWLRQSLSKSPPRGKESKKSKKVQQSLSRSRSPEEKGGRKKSDKSLKGRSKDEKPRTRRSRSLEWEHARSPSTERDTRKSESPERTVSKKGKRNTDVKATRSKTSKSKTNKSSLSPEERNRESSFPAQIRKRISRSVSSERERSVSLSPHREGKGSSLDSRRQKMENRQSQSPSTNKKEKRQKAKERKFSSERHSVSPMQSKTSRSRSPSPLLRESSKSPERTKKKKKKAKKHSKKKDRSLSYSTDSEMGGKSEMSDTRKDDSVSHDGKIRRESGPPEVEKKFSKTRKENRWSSESPENFQKSVSSKRDRSPSFEDKSPRRLRRSRKASKSPVREKSPKRLRKTRKDSRLSEELSEKEMSQKSLIRSRKESKSPSLPDVNKRPKSRRESKSPVRGSSESPVQRRAGSLDQKKESKMAKKFPKTETPLKTKDPELPPDAKEKGKVNDSETETNNSEVSNEFVSSDFEKSVNRKRAWRTKGKASKEQECTTSVTSGLRSEGRISRGIAQDVKLSQVVDMDLCDSDSNMSAKIEMSSITENKKNKTSDSKSMANPVETMDNLEIQDMDISQENEDKPTCDNLQLEDMDISPFRGEGAETPEIKMENRLQDTVNEHEQKKVPRSDRVSKRSTTRSEEEEEETASSVKESKEKFSKKPGRSGSSESRVQRELRKLNIDMVKTAYDFDGTEPRRRSRRSRSNKSSEEESDNSEKNKSGGKDTEDDAARIELLNDDDSESSRAEKKSKSGGSAASSHLFHHSEGTENVDLASIMLPDECPPMPTAKEAKRDVVNINLDEIILPDETPKLSGNVSDTPELKTKSTGKSISNKKESDASTSLSSGAELETSSSTTVPKEAKGTRMHVKFHLSKAATPVSKGKWEDDSEQKISMAQRHMFIPGGSDRARYKISPSAENSEVSHATLGKEGTQVKEPSSKKGSSEVENVFTAKASKSGDEGRSPDSVQGGQSTSGKNDEKTEIGSGEKEKSDDDVNPESRERSESAFEINKSKKLPDGFSWKKPPSTNEESAFKGQEKSQDDCLRKSEVAIDSLKAYEDSGEDMEISSGSGNSDIETVEMDDTDVKTEENIDTATKLPLDDDAPPPPPPPAVHRQVTGVEIPLPETIPTAAPIPSASISPLHDTSSPAPVPPPATKVQHLQPEQIKQMENIKNYYNKMLEQAKSQMAKSRTEKSGTQKETVSGLPLVNIPLPREEITNIPLPPVTSVVKQQSLSGSTLSSTTDIPLPSDAHTFVSPAGIHLPNTNHSDDMEDIPLPPPKTAEASKPDVAEHSVSLELAMEEDIPLPPPPRNVREADSSGESTSRKADADTTSTEDPSQEVTSEPAAEKVKALEITRDMSVPGELGSIKHTGDLSTETVKLDPHTRRDIDIKPNLDVRTDGVTERDRSDRKNVLSSSSRMGDKTDEVEPDRNVEDSKKSVTIPEHVKAKASVSKKNVIKIAPILMSKSKQTEKTTAKESSEEGEIKSETETDETVRQRKVGEVTPIRRVLTPRKEEEKVPSSGFGVITKKSKWDIQEKQHEGGNPHSIQSSAVSSVSSDSEYDKQVDEFLKKTESSKESSYEQKVDEFLKKVEKTKSTVERKFDEFLERVRKPQVERKFEEFTEKSEKEKILEKKVDEFLERTRRKDSKVYDEYRSSRYEREERYERDEVDDRRRKSRDYHEDRREGRGKDRNRRRERDSEERYYGRRERDRSPERSRDRRRSRSLSRERFRDRERDWSRSRSRERRDRHKGKHRGREERRRDASSSDDERTSHRSSKRRSDREERRHSKDRDKESSRNDERLTDEWLRLESEISKDKSVAGSSKGVSVLQQPPPLQQEYYQDAYGNFIPVNPNANNNAETYPTYPYVAGASSHPQATPQYGTPAVQAPSGVPVQLSSQPGIAPQAQIPPPYASQPSYVAHPAPQYQPQPQPVYGHQGQIVQGQLYGVDQSQVGIPQMVSTQSTPSPQIVPPQSAVAPHHPLGMPHGVMQPRPNSLPGQPHLNIQMTAVPPVLHGADGRPIPQFHSNQVPSTLPQIITQQQPGAPSYMSVKSSKPSLLPFPFPTQKAQTVQQVQPEVSVSHARMENVYKPIEQTAKSQIIEENRSGTPVPQSPGTPREDPMGVGSFLNQLFQDSSDKPDSSETADENSQSDSEGGDKGIEQTLSSASVGRALPIKLGIKQDFQSGKEFEATMPQTASSQAKEGKPEKVKSRWRRFSELDMGSPTSMMSPTQDSSNLPSSTVADVGSSEVSGKGQDGGQKWKKGMVYDAWDPASDLLMSPTAQKPGKKERELVGTKKERKEREKPSVQNSDVTSQTVEKEREDQESKEEEDGPAKPPYFEEIEENLYLTERKRGKKMKEVRRMLCDCTTSREEREQGIVACGEDCLNRMLYIECGSRCPCGEYCTNKRFQKRQFADVEPFQTDWKGFGLRTNVDLNVGDFVMEYIGEVLDYKQFKSRTKQQAKMGQEHHYFMALNSDEVIDASYKGNVSRFMNHSCDPNCETQKWTVNGVLRVGFFVKKPTSAMTELTFDYQFERYGKEAQKCFCGAANCRGTIGGSKMTPLKSTRKAEVEKRKITELFEDEAVEEQLEEMNSLESGLRNKQDVLNLCRLMVRIESPENRLAAISVLEKTSERNCLRLFLDYHGLDLLWTWMTDSREETAHVKEQILCILKKLPVPNKNILQDSKILSLVQRLANQNDDEEGAGSSQAPPPPPSKDKPQSILSSVNKDKPVKKRVKFADDASSSDNESRSSATEGTDSTELGTDGDSVVKEARKSDGVSDLCRQVLEKNESGQNVTDDSLMADSTNKESDTENNSVITEIQADSTYDSDSKNTDEEKVCDSSQSKGQLGSLAASLLEQWKDLKELFRIPKKEQVEERKRIEKALDEQRGKERDRYEMIQDRSKQRAAGWDTKPRKRKKHPPPPPPLDDDDRRVLLPTPPKMSKEERRQLFEAQVKAQDEMQAERMRKQCEAYAQFYAMYFNHDPNNPAPMVDPNNPLIGVDPGVFQQLPSEIQAQILQAHGIYVEGMEAPQQQYIDPNTGLPIPPEQLQQLPPEQLQALGQQVVPPVMYTEDGQPIQQSWVEQPQVPQAYIDAQGQLVQATQQDLYGQQSGFTALGQGQVIPQGSEVTQGLQQGQMQHIVQMQDPQNPVFMQQVANLQQQLEIHGQLSAHSSGAGHYGDDEDPPPPPSPPKPKVEKLPPHWKSAKDSEGKTYYYHMVTRQTQWDPPAWETGSQDDMDLESPTYDEIIKNQKKRQMTTTAAADTSSELAKKIKDQFRSKMSGYVVVYLNPYRKPDCKVGRINSTEDFKHLARKLTHHVMAKELKHCRHVEDLEVNENVKAKAKDYVRKYMSKFGSMYRKTGSPDI